MCVCVRVRMMPNVCTHTHTHKHTHTDAQTHINTHPPTPPHTHALEVNSLGAVVDRNDDRQMCVHTHTHTRTNTHTCNACKPISERNSCVINTKCVYTHTHTHYTHIKCNACHMWWVMSHMKDCCRTFGFARDQPNCCLQREEDRQTQTHTEE